MDGGFRCGRGGLAAVLFAVLAGGVLLGAGCRANGPPVPPEPWPVVNAVLPQLMPLYEGYAGGDEAGGMGGAAPDAAQKPDAGNASGAEPGPDAVGDTRVVARCCGCENFWQKTRGNWEYTWMVVRFDVEAVERGTWPDATLSFICWDSWPTPESGIMVDKLPWPYCKDARFAFDLDTSQKPPLVVKQKTLFDPRHSPETQPTMP